MTKVDLKTLVEIGAHFGHQAKRWNPKMEGFMHGIQDGVYVFDLIKTKELFDEALEYLTKAASEGKHIVFLGTKKQAKDKVLEVAQNTGSMHVTERWLGGTFTNFDQIKASIKKLAQMKEDKKADAYADRTKKERVLIDREIDRLERFFGGLAGLEAIPDVLIVIDTKKETGAVREAKATGVTVVGIVDSNADPDVVDYPIPMNDDAKKSLDYALDLLGEAIMEGKKKPAGAKKTVKAKKAKTKTVGKKTVKARVKKVKNVARVKSRK